MIVSKVRQISKSSEVGGGRTAAAAAPTGSADASPEVVPVEGGGMVPEGSTLGHLELGLN